ncbi:hypothetical protein C8R43DRAFT_946561 [Mycena crocata]|nr:hypothetical protein C8R43DRAFT_946561 [Mycena crocata]
MSLWNFTFEDTRHAESSWFKLSIVSNAYPSSAGYFSSLAPIADVSYSPLTNGWIPWYSGSGFISTNGEGGTGDSFHRTSLDGASVNLEFYGTAVYMYGATNSSYDTSLNDAPYPTSGLLLSVTDLNAGTHSVTLTARPTSSSQQLAFNRAVISAPLVNNKILAEAFYDNMDTAMLAYTGDWTEPTFDGIPNATFIDDGPNVDRNGSTYWKVPDALLFYQGGLDPSKNHTVKLTNSGGLKLSLNSIRVHHMDLAQNPNATASGTPPSSASGIIPSSASGTTASSGPQSVHSTVNAGVIAGSILVVALLLFIGCFFWWRSWRNRSRALKEQTEIEAYTVQSSQGLSPSRGLSISVTPRSPFSINGTTQVSSTWASDGKTRTAPLPAQASPSPAPVSAGLESPDVDRLIELIAQRIDRGRDVASPPEYRD